MHQTTVAQRLAPRVEPPGPHQGIGFREFVGLVAALMATNALAIDTMLPALPNIASSLGVHEEASRGWIITAFIMGFGAAQIMYGPLADRIGRRPVLIGGLACYVLFGAGAACATSFGMLLAFRVAQGFAVAATRVVTISVVRDCYSGRQMARVTSLAYMVFLAVPVLAPSIGQFMLAFMPWRGLFLGLAAYGALVLTWLLLRLPETLHPDYRRPIDPRTIRRAIAVTVADRQSRGYAIAQAMVNGALLGFINSLQPIFADIFRVPHLMPTVFAGTAGMMMLASLLNARVVERLGSRRMSHGAILGFLVVELVHLGIVLSDSETIASFAICQGAAMFCFGLSFGNFGALAMEPLAAVAGTAASTQGCFVTVLGGLFGYTIGAAFDRTTLPMTLGFVIAGVLALAAILVTERGRLFRPQHADPGLPMR
ncbi:multidrug effflux MFS transporter [Sphingomonas sp.]|uniref:multidrug effflux MFS transporter n=1 Tax=Sphingomonas sp. TaxID=28214 RepID=UPI003B009524